MSFSTWQLYCLLFSDLRLLITLCVIKPVLHFIYNARKSRSHLVESRINLYQPITVEQLKVLIVTWTLLRIGEINDKINLKLLQTSKLYLFVKTNL